MEFLVNAAAAGILYLIVVAVAVIASALRPRTILFPQRDLVDGQVLWGLKNDRGDWYIPPIYCEIQCVDGTFVAHAKSSYTVYDQYGQIILTKGKDHGVGNTVYGTGDGI